MPSPETVKPVYTCATQKEPEDDVDGMPELFPEESEEPFSPGPTPSTPKMLDSWEAVPRRILQPCPEPARKGEASTQAQAKKKGQTKKAKLCGTNRALVIGVWQTDASEHTLDGCLKRRDVAGGTATLAPEKGKAKLRVAYSFYGIERKSSIADCLKKDCAAKGFGLEMHEIDTLVGGEAHDPTKPELQDERI